MTAGMAANRPMAVANSASAMPGATTASEVLLAPAMAVKLRMMPQTVPNRPTKGRDRTDRCEDVETVAQAIELRRGGVHSAGEAFAGSGAIDRPWSIGAIRPAPRT